MSEATSRVVRWVTLVEVCSSRSASPAPSPPGWTTICPTPETCSEKFRCLMVGNCKDIFTLYYLCTYMICGRFYFQRHETLKLFLLLLLFFSFLPRILPGATNIQCLHVQLFTLLQQSGCGLCINIACANNKNSTYSLYRPLLTRPLEPMAVSQGSSILWRQMALISCIAEPKAPSVSSRSKIPKTETGWEVWRGQLTLTWK